MTTPYERLRSLGRGLDLLKAIATDEHVPKRLRLRADILKEAYPPLAQFQLLARQDGASLPSVLAESIEAAWKLFWDLRASRRGSEPTLRFLEGTMRHFPPAGDAAYVAECGTRYELKAWIDEDPYGQ